MKPNITIDEYSRRLFAANLVAAVCLGEIYDPEHNHAWSAAGDDWANEFQKELFRIINNPKCGKLRRADYRKALAILDEMENGNSPKCADLFTASFADGRR